MIKVIRNNVDNYPSLIEFDSKEEVVSYLRGYYSEPEDKAEELISTGYLSINDSSCTTFEVQ